MMDAFKILLHEVIVKFESQRVIFLLLLELQVGSGCCMYNATMLFLRGVVLMTAIIHPNNFWQFAGPDGWV